MEKPEIENLRHLARGYECNSRQKFLASIEFDKLIEHIEYLEGKVKNSVLDGVSHCANEFDSITAKITRIGFTTPSDHGFIKLELPYEYYKIKEWEKGDEVEIKHCG